MMTHLDFMSTVYLMLRLIEETPVKSIAFKAKPSIIHWNKARRGYFPNKHLCYEYDPIERMGSNAIHFRVLIGLQRLLQLLLQ